MYEHFTVPTNRASLRLVSLSSVHLRILTPNQFITDEHECKLVYIDIAHRRRKCAVSRDLELLSKKVFDVDF